MSDSHTSARAFFFSFPRLNNPIAHFHPCDRSFERFEKCERREWPRHRLARVARSTVMAFLFVGSFATTFAAGTAEDALLLPEVVVTTSAFRLSPNSSLTSTILDRRVLAAYGPRTAGDAIAHSAGVDTASIGPPGSSQLVSLRGSSSEQVLVLLDGRRMNPAQGGGADLSLVPLDSLERVEIIRGCAPSRYGAEGLGGVVNLVTRLAPPASPQGRLVASSGSAGSRRLSGSLRSPLLPEKDVDLDIHAAVGSLASGYEFRDPLRSETRFRENSDSLLRTVKAALGARPFASPGGPRFFLEGEQTLAQRGSPGLVEFPTPKARLDETRGSVLARVLLDVTSEDPGSASFTALASSRMLRYRDPAAAPVPAADRHAHDLREFTSDVRLGWSDRFRVRSGAGLAFQTLDSTTDGLRFDRTFFLSIEPRVLVGRFTGVPPDQDLASRLSFEGGLRLETSLLHPSLAAPRAGLLVTLHRPSRLAVRANGGLLTRNPSFDDLFFSTAGFARGNPDLRPEKARALDAGVMVSPGSASFSLTFFRHDVRDLIQWSPDFAGRWRPLNLSRARMTGLEGEGSLRLPASRAWTGSLDGSFTVLRAVDRSGDRNLNGKTLPRRPPFKSSAGVRLGWKERLRWHWRSRFVSYRWLDSPNVRFLPGCTLHETGVSVSPVPGFDLSFALYNLADRDFVDLNEYPLPGRQWEMKTSVAF